MPDRDLTINLKVNRQQGERAARQFHANERKRIQETAAAQDRATAQQVKSLTDMSRQAIRINRRMEDQIRKGVDRRIALTRKENAEQIRDLYRIRDARLRLLQEEVKGDEQRFQRIRKARASFLIQYIRDTEAARREQVRIAEQGIKQELDNEASFAKAQKALREKADRDRAAARAAEATAGKKEAMDFASAQEKADRESLANFKASLRDRDRLRHQADRGRAAALKQAVEADKQAAEDGKQKRIQSFRDVVEKQKKLLRELDAFEKKIDGDRAAFEESDLKVKQARRLARIKGFQDRLLRYTESVQSRTRGEFAKTGEAIDGQGKKLGSLAKMYIGLRVASLVQRSVQFAFDAVGRSAKEAADYVDRLVRDMQAMREAAGEILAMRGLPITGANAAQIARRAAANAVSVESQQAFESTQEELTAGVLFNESDKVKVGRISREALASLNAPTMAAALGGGPGMQEAAARVQDVLIRTAKRDGAGRIDVERLREDFPAIMESVQLARGNNADAARQIAEAIQEFGGEGKMISDPRRVAALMQVAMLGNEKKGGTLVRAGLKGVLQVRNDQEKMDLLREKGMTGKEEGDEFFFKSLEAIKKIAKDEGRTYQETLYDFYGDLREFELGEIARLNRDVYDQSLKGMAGARQRMEAKAADYKADEKGRFEAERSGARASDLKEGARFAELDILEQQARKEVSERRLLQKPASGIFDAAVEAAREQHINLNREQYEVYQLKGFKVRLELQAQAARGSRRAQEELDRGDVELSLIHPFVNPDRQRDALEVARQEAARSISPQERDAEMARREQLRRDAELARSVGGVSATAPVPLPIQRPSRVVLPPRAAMRDLMREESRGRVGRGRRIVLPGANGRISRSFRHGYAGEAPVTVSRARRATPAGPGNPADLGRVGAGAMYSAGMFAADPEHEMARLRIIGNHNFLGRYRERQEATMADMSSRRAGMQQRREGVANALAGLLGMGGYNSSVPPAMPMGKPPVQRN